MAFMEWTEKMSVSVPSLDNDHQKLVSLINELHEAMVGGRGKEAVGTTLDALIVYTLEHFEREEGFLKATDYPNITSHMLEHEKLTRQVRDIQQRYTSGDTFMISLDVMNFLKDWLNDHILGTDMKYSAHLKSKGIS